MARKFISDIDLAKSQLNNARVQNLASAPSSPVAGQIYYDTTLNQFGYYNGTTWVYANAGSGDTSTNTSTSVDGEMVLFNGTTGKSLKRATGSGVVKLTSGVATPNATLNDVGSPTAAFSMNSQRITTMADPTSAQDAATKNYVDLAVQGIAWKASVRAATTAAGTLASSFANGSVIDGVTLATGDRILVKNQATGTENGIYTVNATGAPTRATDADTGAEMSQAAVFVREGTTNADSAWVCSNDGTITLGTTSLTFVQFTTAGGVQNATTTTSGISRYATQAEAQAKSISNAALTPAAVADFARKYTGLIGDGSSTSIAVTHGLGSQYVTAQVFDASTNLMVECDTTLTSSTQTTFTFATAPASNAYRVVIVG